MLIHQHHHRYRREHSFPPVPDLPRTSGNPYRYCSEYYDEETGLYYLRNRYYDPALGRFITEDPAQDGLNWYVYAGNNPVSFVDTRGFFEMNDWQLTLEQAAQILLYTMQYYGVAYIK